MTARHWLTVDVDGVTHYAKAVRRPNGRADHWLVFATVHETTTGNSAEASFKTLTEARQWYPSLKVRKS